MTLECGVVLMAYIARRPGKNKEETKTVILLGSLLRRDLLLSLLLISIPADLSTNLPLFCLEFTMDRAPMLQFPASFADHYFTLFLVVTLSYAHLYFS
jgi:hypothetical protein